MGYYIETPRFTDRAAYLVEHYDAIIVPPPAVYPEDKTTALLCVIGNGAFEAVALCHSRAEFEWLTWPADYRKKVWLLMDKETAHRLSGFQGG